MWFLHRGAPLAHSWSLPLCYLLRAKSISIRSEQRAGVRSTARLHRPRGECLRKTCTKRFRFLCPRLGCAEDEAASRNWFRGWVMVR